MKARSLLILAAAAGTLAACSTTGGRLPPTEVIRYHLGEPIARGTIRVEPLSSTGPASAGPMKAGIKRAAAAAATIIGLLIVLLLLSMPHGAVQRIGGAYCRPPWVHSLFRPRAILSFEPVPT